MPKKNATRVLHALVVLSLLVPSLAFGVEPASETAGDSEVVGAGDLTADRPVVDVSTRQMPGFTNAEVLEGRRSESFIRPVFDRPEPRL